MRAQALTRVAACVAMAVAVVVPAGASYAANGRIAVVLWSEACGSMDCEQLPDGVVLVRPDGGAARRVPLAGASRPRFSSDGRFLAAEAGWQAPGGPGIAVGAPDARRFRYVDRADWQSYWGMDWSPRSDDLVFAKDSDSDLLLVRISVETGQRVTLGAGLGPAWSPDGRWIAFRRSVNETPAVWVTSPQGDGTRMLTPQGGSVQGWSADGRRVVFRRDEGDAGDGLFAVDVVTGAMTRMKPPHRRRGLLSPDGRLRVTTGPGGVYVARRDGSHRRRIMGPARRWGSDGYAVCDWQPIGTVRRFADWRARVSPDPLCAR